jgi:signal peptidase I
MERSLLIAYSGSSMNPTLDARDLLEVVPYRDQPVRMGDVIYFLPMGGGQAVVHRVTGVTAAGLRTRGDNNSRMDSGILPIENVVGQVAAAVRGDRRRIVRGGMAGWIQGTAAHVINALDHSLRPALHGPYHFLSRVGLGRFLPRLIRPRVAAFRTGANVHYKVLIGRRTVGWYEPSRKIWQIIRPYRLFVRESSLPQPPEVGVTIPMPD